MENDFVQLGFVGFPQADADPVFLQKQLLCANQIWANYLAPGPGAPSVQVRREWADFFTMLLLSPGASQWTKSFLFHQLWSTSLLTILQKPYLSICLLLYQFQGNTCVRRICLHQHPLILSSIHPNSLLLRLVLNLCLPVLHLKISTTKSFIPLALGPSLCLNQQHKANNQLMSLITRQGGV